MRDAASFRRVLSTDVSTARERARGGLRRAEVKMAEASSASPAELHKLVPTTGILHAVARTPAKDEKKQLLQLSNKHGLRNQYLKHAIEGTKSEHAGWQPIDRVKWLLHQPTGAIVVVAGLPKHFYESREALRERLGMESDVMSFELRQFERLLNTDDDTVVAQKTPGFSADQQFHNNEWGRRERSLKALVAEQRYRPVP